MSERRRSAPPEPEWAHYSGAARALVMCNALLAFALELATLAFVVWWALTLGLSVWQEVLIAVASVAALGVLWGTFASPRARIPVPVYAVLGVKAVAFGAGALALWSVGHQEAAVAFGVLAAANTAVVTYVRTRPII